MKTIRFSLFIMVIACLCLWQCKKEIRPIPELAGIVKQGSFSLEGIKITLDGKDSTFTDKAGSFMFAGIEFNENSLIKAEKEGMQTVVQQVYGEQIELNFEPAIIATDYEGNKYKTVTIGDQVWMAKNLRSTKYDDGTTIDSVWAYDNDDANVSIYGRLYNWTAAMKLPPMYLNKEITVNYPHQGVCPTGWHVPSNDEWQELQNYGGGEEIGKKLKTTGNALDGTGLWNYDYVEPLGDEGTNASGFSAVPGGIRYSDGTFDGLGNGAYFWSSSPGGGELAWTRYLWYGDSWLYRYGYYRTGGFSIRCVQD